MNRDGQYLDGAHESAATENRTWRVQAPVFSRSEDGLVPARLEARFPELRDSDTLSRALHRSEALRIRGAYLMAAAGHDLRQPLQIIAMVLDALARSRLSASQLEWLKVAAGEISSLSASPTDLAFAAQLSEPERTRVPLRDVLGLAAESWRRHATARGLELRIRQTSLVVRRDPRLLTTILRNLVGNAVKHTRAGGVLVGCRPKAEGVRIDVVDTGPGLPRGVFKDVIEAHEEGEGSVEGLGLGLAIVRDAIERVGCTLSIRTIEGRGTCFSLMIPNTPRSRVD